MASVQQAVLEFDEAVQAPWRPSLRGVSGERPAEAPRPAGRPVRPGAYRDRVGPSRPQAVQVAHRLPGDGRAPSAAAVGRHPVASASGRPAPTARAARRAAPEGAAGRGDGRPVSALRTSAVRPTAGPARQTRRARRLATVLALAAGVALGSWLGPLIGGGDGDLRLAGVSTVVVGSGDTLWSIASSVAGDRDVGDVVHDIQVLNRLDGTVLEPGQVLELP